MSETFYYILRRGGRKSPTLLVPLNTEALPTKQNKTKKKKEKKAALIKITTMTSVIF